MKRTEPPNGGLLNRQWPYVNAASTDIRKTFERARRAQQGYRPVVLTLPKKGGAA